MLNRLPRALRPRRLAAFSPLWGILVATALLAACADDPDASATQTPTSAADELADATSTVPSSQPTAQINKTTNAEVAPLESSPTDTDAVVDRVIDGDSVDLLVDGTIVEARLIGINAPEFADCQGPASAEALEIMAGGQNVTVVDYGFDRFGRQLVDLMMSGQSVNAAMVKTGWALGQHSDQHPDAAAWVGAMIMAADDKIGMWSMPDECPLSGADVHVSDAQANPPGPDDDVLDQEWIEITNRGEAAVDLDGWAVRDESSSNRLLLPEMTLGSMASLRIVTGCGNDTDTTVYWCSNNGVWSNQGDTALVLGPSGAIESWALIG